MYGGDEAGAGFVALAAQVDNRLLQLKNAITAGIPIPNDGGANLQSTILAFLAFAGWPQTTAATKFKAV